MNKNYIYWSLPALILISGLFVFQNCNKAGFRASNSAGLMSGLLKDMTTDGDLTGELKLTACNGSDCPDKIKVVAKFDSTLIGEGEAHAINNNNADSNTKYYAFQFFIPAQYKCKPITVIATDPRTFGQYQVPNDIANFAMWGGDNSCGGAVTLVPKVDIENSQVKFPVVKIEGLCTNGSAGVDAVGDFVGVDSNVICEKGKFRFCTIGKKQGPNTITLTQTLNGQKSEETVTVQMPKIPVVEFYVTEIAQTQASSTSTVIKGKCTPGSTVDFAIYGAAGGSVLCSADGTFTHNLTLVANHPERVCVLKQTHPGLNPVTIKINVDSNKVTNFTCSMDQFISDTFCDEATGTINGKCYSGTAVQVLVDNKLQSVVVCKDDGTFTVPGVVLNTASNDQSSEVKIIQLTGHAGKTCTSTVTKSGF